MQRRLKKQRDNLLDEFHDWVNTPMIVLGFVWLSLVILDLLTGIPRWLSIVNTIIWIIFILDFLVEIFLASDKIKYLNQNWLVALSLFIPALRIFRILRFIRVIRFASAARGLRFLTIMTSLNRGMKALRATMRRRGLGYIIALTILITFTGAAGMYAFENGLARAFDSYWSSLWWTAMIMTTMGSQDWPQTQAGQLLCLFLAVYAFAIFGYVTGNLASFFIGRDSKHQDSKSHEADLAEVLRSEIGALRHEIKDISARDKTSSEEN
ncbi:MAG TPA: ion transporter [Syntrophorhabdaceae bacterium]|nr:ion transporter [Syntrophorhabdaceae bacterium]